MLLRPQELGVEKLVRIEGDRCFRYVGVVGDETFSLYLYKGELSLYFKVIPNSTGDESCDGAALTPVGLYGFARNEEELVVEMKKKIRELRRS
jgi:hypothetical protein